MIVWLFGPGAVGKKTLMYAAIKPDAFDLRKLLGFTDVKEIVFPVITSRHFLDGSWDLKDKEYAKFRLQTFRRLFRYPLNYIVHGQWEYGDKFVTRNINTRRHHAIYLKTSMTQLVANRKSRGIGINYSDLEAKVNVYDNKYFGEIAEQFNNLRTLEVPI